MEDNAVAAQSIANEPGTRVIIRRGIGVEHAVFDDGLSGKRAPYFEREG